MRSRTSKSGTLLALAAVAALSLAGCGSSGTPQGHGSSTSSPSAGASAGAGSTGAAMSPAQTRKTIRRAFVAFFAGSTPAGRKIGLVQHGSGFARVIHKQAGSPIAQGATVKVEKVRLDNGTTASVRYTVLLGGQPALAHQSGKAVRDHGTWKVSAGTFCTLLSLEQSAPPLCSKAG
ncbi:MAG: hypothetical protein ACRDPH_16260 [Marmoricola sp.]